MANSDSYQLARSVVDTINSVKRSKRSMAELHRSQLSEVDSVIVNPAKKAILVDGLVALGIDANELKAEMDTLVAVNQHVLDNVPELTK